MKKVSLLLVSALVLPSPARAAGHTNHRYWGNLRAREYCDGSAPGALISIEPQIAYAESKYFSVSYGKGESDKSAILTVKDYDEKQVCRIEIADKKIVSVEQLRPELGTNTPVPSPTPSN